MSGETISVTIGDTQRPGSCPSENSKSLIMKALIKPMRVGDRVLNPWLDICSVQGGSRERKPGALNNEA